VSIFHSKSAILSIALMTATSLGGCVSQSEHDELNAKHAALVAEHEQYTQKSEANTAALNQKIASQSEHVSRLQSALHFTLQDDMLFKSGSWTLSKGGEESLAGVAQKLGPDQQDPIVVTGYTDNQPVGASLKKQGIDSNDTLSQKRAETVREWLVQHGVKADMVMAKGLGEADPVAPNDTVSGQAQNRRVEITVNKS
jgi:chemotaxis protein MotB